MIASNSIDAEIKSLENELGIGDETSTIEESDVKPVVVPKTFEEQRSNLFEQVTYTPIDMVKGAGRGVFKAVDNVISFSNDAVDWVNQSVIQPPADNMMKDINDPTNDQGTPFSFASLLDDPRTTPGKIAQGVTQYMAPLMALGPLGYGTGVKGIVASGMLNAAVIDPNEERLSDLLMEYPMLQNPVMEYLASDSDDDELEGRFKTFLESVIVDSALVKGFHLSLKIAKNTRRMKAGAKEAIKKAGSLLPDTGAEKTTKAADDIIDTKTGKKISPEEVDLEAEVKPKPEPEETFKSVEALADSDPKIKKKVFNADQEDIVFIDPEEVSKIKTEKDLDRALQINLSRFETTDDVKAAMKTFIEKNPKLIQKFSKGVISDAEIKVLGLKKTQTPEGVEVVTDQLGNLMEADDVYAARLIRDNLGEKMSDVLMALAKDPTNDALAKQSILLQRSFGKMASEFAGTAEKTGRSLRAHGIPIDPESLLKKKKQNLLQNILEVHGGTSTQAEIAEMFETSSKNMDKRELKNAFWKKAALGTWSGSKKMWNIAYEIMINGILSGPPTHAVNVASAAMSGTESIARAAVEEIPLLWRAATPDGVQKGEAMIMAKSFWNNFRNSIKMSAGVKRLPYRMQTKLLVPGENALSAKNVGLDNPTNIATRFLAASADTLGDAITSPSKFLRAEDIFAKSLNFRMTAERVIHRQAIMAKKIPGSKEYKKFFEDSLEDMTSVTRKQAQLIADENTFTRGVSNKFKSGELSEHGVMGGAFAGLTETLNKVPGVGQVLAPFTRVSLNLIDYNMQRIPGVNFLLPSVRADWAAGGARQADVYSKMVFGASLFTTVAGLGAMGLITGREPKDRETLKALKQGNKGWQPHSLKVGDKYYSLDRLDHVGAIIRAGADFSDLVGHLDDEDSTKLVMAYGLHLTQNLTPEFLTSSLKDLMDVLDENSTTRRKFDLFAQKTGAAFIPFSGFSRTLRKLNDDEVRMSWPDPNIENPLVRTFEGIYSEFQNIVPGLSENLPPSRNILGDVIHYPPGWGPDFISPFYVSGETTALHEELHRLGMPSGGVDFEPAPGEEWLKIAMPSKVITERGSFGKSFKRELTPQEYDKLVQLSAGIGLRGSEGHTLKDMLEFEVLHGYPSDPGIANIKDPAKADERKKLVLKRHIQLYKRLGKAQFILEHKDIIKDFLQQRVDRAGKLSEQVEEMSLEDVLENFE